MQFPESAIQGVALNVHPTYRSSFSSVHRYSATGRGYLRASGTNISRRSCNEMMTLPRLSAWPELTLCFRSGGEIRCTIAEENWSASDNTKLIEKGTSGTGIYQTGAKTGMTHGQGRGFLITTKLRTRLPLILIYLDTRAAGE